MGVGRGEVEVVEGVGGGGEVGGGGGGRVVGEAEWDVLRPGRLVGDGYMLRVTSLLTC